MCTARAHVRFTPNSDRESGLPRKVMSALPPKADFDLRAPKVLQPSECCRCSGARGETALQRKVTRLNEKSGFSSSLPPVWQLNRANCLPRRRWRGYSQVCHRCWSTSAGRTAGGFLRALHGSTQGDATPSSSPRDCKTRSPIIKRFLAATWFVISGEKTGRKARQPANRPEDIDIAKTSRYLPRRRHHGRNCWLVLVGWVRV